MSVSRIVARGYGSFGGGVNYLPTRGYAVGAAVVVEQVGGGPIAILPPPDRRGHSTPGTLRFRLTSRGQGSVALPIKPLSPIRPRLPKAAPAAPPVPIVSTSYQATLRLRVRVPTIPGKVRRFDPQVLATIEEYSLLGLSR